LKNYLGSVGKITPIGSQEKITTNLLVWLNDKSWSEIKPLLHVGANDVLTNTARRFSPLGLCIDQQGVRPEKWDRFSNKYARPVISNGKQPHFARDRWLVISAHTRCRKRRRKISNCAHGRPSRSAMVGVHPNEMSPHQALARVTCDRQPAEPNRSGPTFLNVDQKFRFIGITPASTGYRTLGESLTQSEYTLIAIRAFTRALVAAFILARNDPQNCGDGPL
jgi:hypothetical protein